MEWVFGAHLGVTIQVHAAEAYSPVRLIVWRRNGTRAWGSRGPCDLRRAWGIMGLGPRGDASTIEEQIKSKADY
eukprot:817840-Pyramimonas_sp.AAC.1